MIAAKTGMDMYLAYRKQKVMEKAAHTLKKQRHIKTQNDIKRLNHSMVALSKIYHHHYQSQQRKLQTLTQELKHQKTTSLLAKKLGRIGTLFHDGRYMTNNYVQHANCFLDGISALADGQITEALVPTTHLRNMLRYVGFDLLKHYPEYRLAFPRLDFYYRKARVDFTRVGPRVLIQVPVYVKHYRQSPLDLYRIQTIPVPFHPDLTYPLE